MKLDDPKQDMDRIAGAALDGDKIALVVLARDGQGWRVEGHRIAPAAEWCAQPPPPEVSCHVILDAAAWVRRQDPALPYAPPWCAADALLAAGWDVRPAMWIEGRAANPAKGSMIVAWAQSGAPPAPYNAGDLRSLPLLLAAWGVTHATTPAPPIDTPDASGSERRPVCRCKGNRRIIEGTPDLCGACRFPLPPMIGDPVPPRSKDAELAGPRALAAWDQGCDVEPTKPAVPVLPAQEMALARVVNELLEYGEHLLLHLEQGDQHHTAHFAQMLGAWHGKAREALGPYTAALDAEIERAAGESGAGEPAVTPRVQSPGPTVTPSELAAMARAMFEHPEWVGCSLAWHDLRPDIADGWLAMARAAARGDLGYCRMGWEWWATLYRTAWEAVEDHRKNLDLFRRRDTTP